jgi:hypothetical protein
LLSGCCVPAPMRCSLGQGRYAHRRLAAGPPSKPTHLLRTSSRSCGASATARPSRPLPCSAPAALWMRSIPDWTSGRSSSRATREPHGSGVAFRARRQSSLSGCTPRLNPAAAVQALRAGGHELILCEGGPTVLGSLLETKLVDELFLTTSPLLAGRAPGRSRPGLVETAEFLPARSVSGRLLSLRRDESHLFARYALTPSTVLG